MIALPPPPPAIVHIATWYARGLPNPEALTCASRVYPRGTRLRVTHKDRSVIVRVNDYGPTLQAHQELGGRDIDLSLGAARVLGIVREGVAKVKIEEMK
jgi:rare lipoprotein A